MGASCDAGGGNGGCGCGGNVSFDGTSAEYRRRLWMVIAINGAMFLVELIGGALAGSRALQADALDFFGDTLTYGISLAVIGMSLRVRATAALAKGVSLLLMGLWVAGSTLWSFFVLRTPEAPVMGAIAFLALAANLLSVLLLVKYKDGDANVRSVWLCSRNDAIGNISVIGAAALVWLTGSAWPDLLVAMAMAALFTSSALRILAQGWAEWRGTHTEHAHAPAPAAPDHDAGGAPAAASAADEGAVGRR
ncbi:MAG TPA: cation transporter [Thermopetrobacter sp.]|nr:cation transporter [Thermopetrobacter sp.]